MSISMSFPTGQEVAYSSSLVLPQLCRQFSFSDILVATQHFDESLVVGRGGFGKVYKGTFTDGAGVLDVAIKRLDSTSSQGALEFWAEVKMLSKLRHSHLVSLIGYCNDEQEMILVYEYMPLGTLEDHLHKRRTSSLSWLRRLKICVGAARGLDYLHTGTGIEHGVIHRDVKSSNILLHDSWAAKISDFGLSKICPTNQPSTSVNTVVKGTRGYLDPHYFLTGKLTRKSDVYAFGVVLLEVLCGKRALDASLLEEQWGLAGWAQDSFRKGKLKQIVDSKLQEKISFKCLKEFAQLADQCLHTHPKERPTMAEVVVCLESVLALQDKAKDTTQPVGITIFGRKVPKSPSPVNGEPSGSDGVQKLILLDKYLYTIGGENPIFRWYDFNTLSVATKNFSKANVIMQHGLGDMYKGRLHNGQEIAIVKITLDIRNIQKEIMNEVSMLVKLEHKTLFSVIGYCLNGTKVFLVYNSAPYATLQCLLFDTKCLLLDWNKRYEILLGVAQVLLYLHKHAPFRVIHGNLTPNNILLDESLDPKLSHFGIARCLPNNETNCIADSIRGTWGYMAPEYSLHGRLSCKADVFSFCVMVLETISGTKAWMVLQETFPHQYAERSWLEGTSFPIDPRIGMDSSLMTRFVEIGLLCIQPNLANRPTMKEVLDMLLGSLSPTLLLLKIQESKLRKIRDDYDVGAVEEFISDLCPR